MNELLGLLYEASMPIFAKIEGGDEKAWVELKVIMEVVRLCKEAYLGYKPNFQLERVVGFVEGSCLILFDKDYEDRANDGVLPSNIILAGYYPQFKIGYLVVEIAEK
jgi:hypothetical protein